MDKLLANLDAAIGRYEALLAVAQETYKDDFNLDDSPALQAAKLIVAHLETLRAKRQQVILWQERRLPFDSPSPMFIRHE